MPARAIVANELARFLSAISHPHRVQIIELLRDDEKDVNTLEEELQISHSSVSQHLSKLRAYRLVKMHREGVETYSCGFTPKPSQLGGRTSLQSKSKEVSQQIKVHEVTNNKKETFSAGYNSSDLDSSVTETKENSSPFISSPRISISSSSLPTH